MAKSTDVLAAHEAACKNEAAIALSYIPVLLAQLDDDGRQMFGVVLQAMREGGYADGYKDAKQDKRARGE